MKLTPVIAALRARCPTFNQNVLGAAGFTSLSASNPATLPAAYVIPAADLPAVQLSQTDYWQTLSEGFTVVVVIASTADGLAQGSVLDDIEALRRELWLALLGFNPETDNGEILIYRGSQWLESDSSRLAVQFSFSRQRTISPDDSHIVAVMAQRDDLHTIAVDINFISPGNGPDNVVEHHSQLTLSE